MPSSSESSVDRMRRSAPESPASRWPASDSNSSRKTTEGDVSRAVPYSSLTIFELSPKYFERMLETFTL